MLRTSLRPYVALRSTRTGVEYPFARIREVSDSGESLEVHLPGLENASMRKGRHLWERFGDFLPFINIDAEASLGEGNTPLLKAAGILTDFCGLPNLLIKDETQNPTWSFKDRGSFTSVLMTQAMNETCTATISTGNMGNSIAAYSARLGLQSLVFIPHFAPEQKVQAISIHGATILRVNAPDYALMKNTILELGDELKLRVVSGNGPVRVEGYKLVAFEIFEQLGRVPEFIAVPTSACGHLRGIWKGWTELKIAGLIDSLPRMIIVQAENNSPIVAAWRRRLHQVVPFRNFQTIAEAITSGNPTGGDELLQKAYEHDWLAETATEDEILDGQQLLARAGHFVEPAAATSLYAVRKLRKAGAIPPDSEVVMMLTGAGFKDLEVMPMHNLFVQKTDLENVRSQIGTILNS